MPGTSEETEKLPVQGVHGALSASSIHPSIPPVLPLWVQRASRERDTVRQTPRFGLRLDLGKAFGRGAFWTRCKYRFFLALDEKVVDKTASNRPFMW